MAESKPRLHPRARRLQPIWQQARQADQQALAEWGRLQQQLQEQTRQQQQLQEYANDYRQQLATPGQQQLTGTNIQNLLQFLGQIDQAADAQKQQLEQLTARIERARQHYLSLKAKTDGLEQLMDKFDQQARQQQADQEQRQADEWANRQAFLARRQ